MVAQPLEGIRVLELGGGLAAAFATHLLAGYGAEVVRVDPPADPDAPPGLTPDQEAALLGGKRRIHADASEIRRLVDVADLVIEDLEPAAANAVGFDPVELRMARDELVIVSISPFGRSGPGRDATATNATVFATSGMMSLTGDPERTPLVTGGSQALHVGGLNAFGASVSALFGAQLQGTGAWVDISVQECLAGMLELYGPGGAYGLPPTLRFGNWHRACWALYPCADGHAGVFCLERQVPSLFSAIGDPALDDPRFRDPLLRPDNEEELSASVIGFMVDHTGDDLLRIGQERKIPFGIVRRPSELLDAPALHTRGFFDEVALPDGTVVTAPGRPFLGLGWTAPDRVHRPGEDTDAVRRAWTATRGGDA